VDVPKKMDNFFLIKKEKENKNDRKFENMKKITDFLLEIIIKK